MRKINLSYIYILFGILICSACQKDEFQMDPITDVFVTTASENPIKVAVGSSISFGDGSIGFVSREWSVSPDSAMFLNNEDTVLTENVAHVQFIETGVVSVNLHLEFPEVSYDTAYYVTVFDTLISSQFTTSVEGTVVEETATCLKVIKGASITFADSSSGNPDLWEWTIEGATNPAYTDSMVTVQYNEVGTYDITFRASREAPELKGSLLKLNKYIEVLPVPVTLGEVIENKYGVIQLHFSEKMAALDANVINDFALTVDDVSANIASIALNSSDSSILEITPETDILPTQTAKLTYTGTTLTSYELAVAESFTDKDVTVFVPLPLQPLDIMELEDETIQISYEDAFEAFTGQENLFTVTVNEVPFTVQSVSVNADNAQKLDIRLTEPIYKSDVVKVTHSGGLLSVDARATDVFTAQTVKMYDKLATAFATVERSYDFEDSSNSTSGWWFFFKGTEFADISTEHFYDSEGTGSGHSLMLNNTGGTIKAESFTAPFPLITGVKYKVTYRVYIEPESTINNDAFKPQVRAPTGNNVSKTVLVPAATLQVDAIPRGEWVLVEDSELQFEYTGEAADGTIRFLLSGAGKIYIDDVTVTELDERPMP